MKSKTKEILEEVLTRFAPIEFDLDVPFLLRPFKGKAISIMEKANVEVIAGVNLPMLIKLASVCDTQSLDEAAESAQVAGRKYINIASKLLDQK